jgi:hypothetical protein
MNALIAIFSALAFASLDACMTPSRGQGQPDDLVALSSQTFSAFRCSLLASDEKDSARVFAIGIATGRRLLESWNRLTDDEQKAISKKIILLWTWSQGPTADFVLGSVYEQIRADVRKLYDLHEEVEGRLDQAYFEENCRLLK